MSLAATSQVALAESCHGIVAIRQSIILHAYMRTLIVYIIENNIKKKLFGNNIKLNKIQLVQYTWVDSIVSSLSIHTYGVYSFFF